MHVKRTVRFKINLAEETRAFLMMTGMLVVLKNYPNYLFVVHEATKEDGGGWTVSEYTTGRRALVGHSSSARKAVIRFEKQLDFVGCDDKLKKAIFTYVQINYIDDVKKKAYKLGYKD
ncbi:MAG: hypothetical protein KAS32_01055 [Candidatus Peribacteraceae bacterium]|nr:hypothetical protein [Candidatus Peribacteraceae bacterium]